MAKIVQAMALCALMAASTTAVSVRGRRRSGGERQLQTTRADTTKTFEQVYFAESMTANSTVILLEAGPFKLEASCKAIVVQNTYSSWYTSYYSSLSSSSYEMEYTDDYSTSYYSYDYDDDYTWDPEGNYTENFLALDLTYTAPEADYVYGPPDWWYHHPNETLLVGPWEAGETRTSTIFRGRDGQYGSDFTLQSLSGNYISVDGGDTIGIHKEHTEWLPGGVEAFPVGIECMVAGFLTYHIPGSHRAT